MKIPLKKVYPLGIRFLLPLLLLPALCGCSAFYLEDCPEGSVIGVDKARIRSWRVRTLLADEAAAAGRFADYAAMSAYAYAIPAGEDCGIKPKLTPEEEGRLEQWLKDADWKRVSDVEFCPPCEDEVGLFYHVWKRESAAKIEVIIAFRGTWGFNDWWYGNAYWFRRLLTDRHQYTAARRYAEKVIKYMNEQNGMAKPLEFSSAGHSLGGGLAQAVFYEQANNPNFKQAYAFAPSSATAFTTRRDKKPFAACVSKGGFSEARIYRIYESKEILANLRIFHKLFFRPEPWFNEVRFNYAAGINPVAQHSMVRFALQLMEKNAAGREWADDERPWFASPDRSCTARFTESQNEACGANWLQKGVGHADQ